MIEISSHDKYLALIKSSLTDLKTEVYNGFKQCHDYADDNEDTEDNEQDKYKVEDKHSHHEDVKKKTWVGKPVKYKKIQ